MRICLDTDVLSEFLRGDHRVVSEITEAVRAGDSRIAITIVTVYEVLKGLRHREAPAKEERFRNALKSLYILPLDESAVNEAAAIYADLRRRGETISDADVLIAGIVMANGYTLVSNNVKHYNRIQRLGLRSWVL